MTPETWQLVLHLFERCLSADSDARAALLAADPALRAEVEKLLEHDRQADEFLEDAPEAVKKLREAPEARFAPGTLLAGRYEIHRLLGCGGMGEVYAAFDREAEIDIALKVSHPEAPADFRRELQLGRQVTHPHVCRLFDLGRHASLPYLTMELLEGETLAARLRRVGPLPLAEAQIIAAQILAALAAIHDAGIVHRDLTPSNVMLLPGRAVVMDFGLATRPCAVDAHTALPLMGTLDYMAPEQLQGAPASHRADLYSAALILREMASPHPHWLPAVELALSADPLARPASARDLAALLAPPPATRHRHHPARTRHITRSRRNYSI